MNADGNTPPFGHYFPNLSVLALNSLHTSGQDSPIGIENMQVTRVVFSRDANGRVLEQAGLMPTGRRVYTMHFARPDLAEYKRDGFLRPIRESGIAYLRVSRVTHVPWEAPGAKRSNRNQ